MLSNAMLHPQQKEALVRQLALLVEMDEPDAALATLRRVAETRAHAVMRDDQPQASRWLDLADALDRVRKERMLGPREPPSAAHEA
jgi:tRNA A37 N6-isopentenylltransferase MiaA